MNRKTPTILLTGAGGAALPFLISAMQKRGCRVIAADMDPYAGGLFLADKGYVIPKADDKRFLPAIEKICRQESVDVVIPLVDEELVHVATLEEKGIITLIPRREFIETCLDKYNLIKKSYDAGIPVPGTYLASDGINDLAFPCIVKPRTGRGSRGVQVLNSDEEYDTWLATAGIIPDQYILQEYLRGPEYTVSVVVWRDGSVQAVVPKEILSKKGVTRFAVTKFNPLIEQYCKDIQDRLHADGPFNVQLCCTSTEGNPRLFEINPRYSTTVSLTMAAGIEEVYGLVLQAIEGKNSFRFGMWKEGVVLCRQTLDDFVPLDEFQKREGRIERT
ncbi:MAG: ATP-grasp domain-containing protein [Deltaproteobacteria bacterium]|nr:ATP-grasp domain-containing protein [Deltaproteobacteria bacterium]